MAKHREQYDRMIRWYNRFKATDQGRPHDMASDNYLDEIHAFFQNCYHLKDWLFHDGAATQSTIDKFIAAHDCLKLCADICNSTKHLKLGSKGHLKLGSEGKSGEQPEFGKKVFGLNVGTAPTTISLESYEVETKTKGPIDSFDLATDCVKAWEVFFKTHNL